MQKTIKKRGEGGGGKGSHTYTLIMLVQAKHGFNEARTIIEETHSCDGIGLNSKLLTCAEKKIHVLDV